MPGRGQTSPSASHRLHSFASSAYSAEATQGKAGERRGDRKDRRRGGPSCGARRDERRMVKGRSTHWSTCGTCPPRRACTRWTQRSQRTFRWRTSCTPPHALGPDAYRLGTAGTPFLEGHCIGQRHNSCTRGFRRCRCPRRTACTQRGRLRRCRLPQRTARMPWRKLGSDTCLLRRAGTLPAPHRCRFLRRRQRSWSARFGRCRSLHRVEPEEHNTLAPQCNRTRTKWPATTASCNAKRWTACPSPLVACRPFSHSMLSPPTQ